MINPPKNRKQEPQQGAKSLAVPGDQNNPAVFTPRRHWIWDNSPWLIFLAQCLAWQGFQKTGTVLTLLLVGGHCLYLHLNGRGSFRSVDLFTGWILTAPFFLYLMGNNSRWVLPDLVRFSQMNVILMGAGGVFMLWHGLRSVPPKHDPGDLSSTQARLLLLALIAFGVVLRMHNANDPISLYWFDQSEEARDAKNILDLSLYRFIFEYGARGPLFTYLVAGIWKLLPDESSLFVIRLSIVLVDAVSIWIFYLLGKEFDGKRRTGLFFAALGAVSRQMILKGFLGTYVNCFILFVAIDLLLLFRLFKKPDLRHFLFWVFAVCLGNYAYMVYRPWTLAMIWIALIWVFSQKEEREAGPSAWVLALGMGGLWIYYFLDSSYFLSQFLGHRPELSVGLIFAFFSVMILAFLELLWTFRKKGKGLKLIYWVISSTIAYWLVYPFFSNNEIYDRFRSSTVFLEHARSMGEFIGAKFQAVSWLVQFLFFGGRDESSIGPTGDSFFDFYAVLVIFLGLMVIIAKPSRLRLFLFVPVLIGVLPCLAGPNSHSARLLGCLVPFYLIGAVGLNHLWEACLGTLDGKKFTRYFFLPIFVIGLVLAAKSNLTRADEWYGGGNPDVILHHQVSKDHVDYRVYVDFTSQDYPPPQSVMDVMFDKKTVYRLNKSNPIYLTQGEKGKTVELIVAKGYLAMEKRLKSDFPNAEWQDVLNMNNDPSFLARVLIPFDQITGDPSKLLYLVRTPDSYWRRKLYDGVYGLAKGIILSEDLVITPTAPFPPGLISESDPPPTCSVEGSLEAHSSGTYLFDCATSTLINFSVEGEKIFDIRPKEKTITRSKKMKLSKGTHSIELKAYLRPGQNIPPVFVTSPDGQKRDLWSAPPL